MADLERFGGELFLNANQYISTVGQVDRANKSLQASLHKTADTAEKLGASFDKSIVGAEKFGKLRDIASGTIIAGLERINKTVDQSINKYAQLAQSGRASFRKLGQELSAHDTKLLAYNQALEKVRRALEAQSKEGADQVKTQRKINDALASAQNAYKAYQKQLEKVNQQGEVIKKENFAIVASYQLLGQRLATVTGGVGKIGAAWANLIAKLGPVKGALSAVKGALLGTGTGTAATGGALAVLGKVAGGVGIAIGALGVAVSGLGKIFKLALSPITKAIGALKNFFKIASQIAVGILIRDTIRSLVREFRELVSAGFEAVKFFQSLEIRLDLMEARAIRAEGEITKFSEVMEEAGRRAASLTQWLKELSLQSPFSIETLAITTTLNMAMGFTEDMAKRLTTAIANYTAGMGLSNQVMERIVFNFGQMKAAGKITGTELRDLARGAFLPMHDILKETARIMGVTVTDFAEFREELSKGKVSVDTFFRAFLNIVERDFSDASKRFSRTLQGVRNRLSNFIKTVIGLEVLKPVFDRIAQRASEALDRIMTPDVIARARLLGLAILRSFDLISNKVKVTLHVFNELWTALGFGQITFESLAFAVAKFTFYLNAAIDFVRKILRRLLKYFDTTGETIVKRMADFGYNAIAWFAKGMAAATKLVVQVLTWVANAISWLLSAFSPPRILPDLPKWGMAAMTSYLEGFTMADFSILEGIQDPVKDALDILEETGEIGENQAGKIYARISKAIAKALSAGEIGEELFAEIERVTGPFGEEIAQLARRQVELAGATEAVRKAEQRLDNARKAHSAARIRTNRLIREYNESLREGADPAFLKAKLAEINASEDAAAAAYEEQKAAEADLEAKEDRLEVVRELLELQTKLVEQLIELTKAQIIQPEQPETGGAGAGAGELPVDEELMPELPPLPEMDLPDADAITAQLDEIFAKAKAAVEENLRKLREAWEKTGLADAFKNLSEAWTNAWTDIREFYDDTVLPFFEGIKTWWEENGPGIASTASGIWEGVKTAAGTVWTFLKTEGKNTIDFLTGWWEDHGESVNTVWENMKTNIGAALAEMEVPGPTRSEWEGFIDLLGNFFGGLGVTLYEDLKERVKTPLEEMGAWFDLAAEISGLTWEEFTTKVGTDAEESGAKIKESWEQTLEDAGIVWGDIVDTAGGLVDEYRRQVEEDVGESGDFIKTTNKEVSEDSATRWQEVTDTVTTRLGEVKSYIEDEIGPAIDRHRTDVLEKWRKFVEETLPDAYQAFQDKLDEVWAWIDENIIAPIRRWIDGPFADLREMIAETLTSAFNTFRVNVLDPLQRGFDRVKSAVDRVKSALQTLKEKVLAFPLALLNLISEKSPSPFAAGLTASAVAMKKMATDALPQLNKQLVLMQSSGLVGASPVAAPAVMPYGAGSSQSVNVQMGGVNIASGMDEAMFEARVLSIVQKGLRI